MTRIGVVSDSHGRLSLVKDAAKALEGCEYIFHLGDHDQDSRAFEGATDARILCVSGNCDWFTNAPPRIVTEIDGARVLAVHGHQENARGGITHLSLKAQSLGAKLVLYGHTHVADVQNDGERIFVNPGALKDGRYAVIEFEGGSIRPFLKRL